MANLISFATTRFDVRNERPNPFNPIAGESVLHWLQGALAAAGYEVTEPDAEDWGWCIGVKGNGSAYLVGASGESARGETRTEWVLQIHKQRTLPEKILGKNKLRADDPLTTAVFGLARREPDFQQVTVAVGA